MDTHGIRHGLGTEGLLGLGLAAGLSMLMVGTVFYLMTPAAIEGLYKEHSQVFRLWPGWTRPYMLVHPLIYGFLFAGLFLLLHGVTTASPLTRGPRGGAVFGIALFLVGSLPVFLLANASMRVPAPVLIAWLLQNLVQYAVAGVVVGAIVDGVTIEVASQFRASTDRVWALLLEKGTFLHITRGLMSYQGVDDWPEVLFTQGAIYRTSVRPFRILPGTSHEFQVVRVDERSREIETEERGSAVKHWRHLMTVEETGPERCRYRDRVQIQAGWRTPLVWAFARVFYRFRHRRWRALLAKGPNPAESDEPGPLQQGSTSSTDTERCQP